MRARRWWQCAARRSGPEPPPLARSRLLRDAPSPTSCHRHRVDRHRPARAGHLPPERRQPTPECRVGRHPPKPAAHRYTCYPGAGPARVRPSSTRPTWPNTWGRSSVRSWGGKPVRRQLGWCGRSTIAPLAGGRLHHASERQTTEEAGARAPGTNAAPGPVFLTAGDCRSRLRLRRAWGWLLRSRGRVQACPRRTALARHGWR